MPNHITNRITIPKEHLDEVLERIKGENGLIDFNRIIPMPEELIDTRSPSQPILEEAEYKKELEQYQKDKAEGKQYVSKPISTFLSGKYKKLYGYDNWYDWCSEKWGTKWNAYDIKLEDNMLYFDTAWACPIPIIEAMSELFPRAIFMVAYADEDIGQNCGEYEVEDGSMVETSEFCEGDEDAIRFACELKGYDYDEYLADQE